MRFKNQASVGKAKSMENAAKQKNLFRGISSNMIISFPSAFCYFFGYDTTRNFVRSETSLGDTTVNMLGGCGAEICANTVRTPFEIVKQRMQVGHASSLVDAFGGLYKLRGLRGMFILI
jgi:solute carrier family 25 (mitochondrial S-adenosylmethionine transporter), member 26